MINSVLEISACLILICEDQHLFLGKFTCVILAAQSSEYVNVSFVIGKWGECADAMGLHEFESRQVSAKLQLHC